MFGKIGMEALFGETAFSGTFYIDNARLLGTEVGANLEIPAFFGHLGHTNNLD